MYDRFLGDTVGNVLLTTNIFQPGESSREGVSRIEAPVLGEGPSGSVHLQPSALDVGSMNAAEAHSDMGLATPISEDIPLVVADREPTPRYGILPLPATSILVTERLDATVPLNLRTLPVTSAPPQRTPDVLPAGPDLDLCATLQTPHPGGSDLFPVQPTLSDAPPDNTESTEGDRELAALIPDSRSGQLPATTIDIAPSPTPPRVCTPLESTEELRDGKPLAATSSEEDISDYLLHTSGGLLGETCAVRQAGGPAESCPDSVPQPTYQIVERSSPPIVEEPTPPAIEEPAAPIVGNPVTQLVEEPVPPATTLPITSVIEKSIPLVVEELIPPVAKNPATPADKVSNHIPREEPILSVDEDQVTPAVEGSIPPAVEDIGTVVDKLTNPSATPKLNPRFIEEPTIPQFLFAPTQDPQPPPHLHTFNAVVDTSNIVDTPDTSGVIRESTSAYQEQDEQDELIVDAILAIPPDLDTVSHLSRDAMTRNELPTSQEKDENSIRVPPPEEAITASPTCIELDSTHDLSNSAVDTPTLTTRRSHPSPTCSQETSASGLSCCPRDTDEVTAEAPLSMEPMTQKPATQLPDSRTILETHPQHEDTNVSGSVSHTFLFCICHRVSYLVRCKEKSATCLCHTSTPSFRKQ